MRKKRLRQKRIMIFSIITLASVIILYIGLSIFYGSHFFAGTYINGINASNKTAKQVKELMKEELLGYELILDERNGIKECIGSTEIDMQLVFDGGLEEALEAQKGYKWPLELVNKEERDMAKAITFDKIKLKNKLLSLKCMDEKNITEPVNAHISEYSSTKHYTIVKEEAGNELIESKALEAIEKAILNLSNELSFEEAGCYAKPEITSEYEPLNEMLSYANKYVGTEIVYDFDDNKEVLNGDTINEWLIFGNDYTVSIDTQKVSEFVNYIGKKYNTIFTKRTFNTSYGKTIEVEGGDYGWWLDRATEGEELLELVRQGAVTQRTPAYFQRAASFSGNDYGDSYVEINLTAQHLFLYKDGKQVLETDFVSGNSAKAYNTPVGTYGITYKERYATLKGENYATPVLYWMPFNGNIGLHDASWRYEFGRDLYMTSGSHGCINLPCGMAQKIYENIEKGTPVIVYELAGTERKDTTRQTGKEIAAMLSHGIDEIGEVTERSKKALEWARAAYNELNAEEKAMVTNLDILEKAEAEYNELKKKKNLN